MGRRNGNPFRDMDEFNTLPTPPAGARWHAGSIHHFSPTGGHRTRDLFSSLNLSLVRLSTKPMDRHWASGPKAICQAHHQLYFVQRGMAWIQGPGLRHSLTAGSVWFLPARSPLRWGTDGGVQFTWAWMTLEALGMPLDYRGGGEPRRLGPMGREDRTLCRNLSSGSMPWARLVALKARVFHWVSTVPGFSPRFEGKGESPLPWDRVVESMAGMVASGGSLDGLARGFGRSAPSFSRAFRSNFGCAPKEWLNRERFRIACLALTGTAEPVAVVARRAGFDDALYFSRFFKAMAGVPPQTYRNQSRGERKWQVVSAIC